MRYLTVDQQQLLEGYVVYHPELARGFERRRYEVVRYTKRGAVVVDPLPDSYPNDAPPRPNQEA